MSIISGPPGPRPEQLLERIPAPLLVLWGDRDTFTPIDGPVGRYFRRLPDVREKTQLQVLPGEHMRIHVQAAHHRLLRLSSAVGPTCS